jgi:hypothetical protein
MAKLLCDLQGVLANGLQGRTLEGCLRDSITSNERSFSYGERNVQQLVSLSLEINQLPHMPSVGKLNNRLSDIADLENSLWKSFQKTEKEYLPSMSNPFKCMRDVINLNQEKLLPYRYNYPVCHSHYYPPSVSF